jgi:hypothetical protein
MLEHLRRTLKLAVFVLPASLLFLLSMLRRFRNSLTMQPRKYLCSPLLRSQA